MSYFRKLAFLFVAIALVLAGCAAPAPAEPAAPASDAAFGTAACAPNCTYKDMTLL